jgi:lipopolysaccharide transport system ATP-binding protein
MSCNPEKESDHLTDHTEACQPASTSAMWAIRAEGLGKCYFLWNNPQDRLKQALRSALPSWLPLRDKRYYTEFWALRNIHFELGRGETVGIVGRNGSGKSTLLQLVCRTLTPTSGSLQTRGKVSALLELGSGFNPDFTGRENIYMNAAILGLSDDEISERYEQIIDFADIGQFIDQPVKNYSTGMTMRLAFAIAISVEPDILVVDEALAVGDEMFQRKCFSRVQRIQERGGTVLFVSHSSGAVLELCNRAILLDAGELIYAGAPKSVIARYHKLLNAPPEKYHQLREEIRRRSGEDTRHHASNTLQDTKSDGSKYGAPLVRGVGQAFYDPNLVTKSAVFYACRGVRLSDFGIYTLDGHQVNNLVRGEKYIYSYKVDFVQSCFQVRYGMLIKTLAGTELGGAVSRLISEAEPVMEQGTRVVVEWNFTCSLLPGVYFCNGGVLGWQDGAEVYLDRRIDALAFRVQHEPNLRSTATVDLQIGCQVTGLGEEKRSRKSL